MKIYKDIPIEEDTIEILDELMEKHKLVNHNAVINFILSIYFLKKSREESQ